MKAIYFISQFILDNFEVDSRILFKDHVKPRPVFLLETRVGYNKTNRFMSDVIHESIDNFYRGYEKM